MGLKNKLSFYSENYFWHWLMLLLVISLSIRVVIYQEFISSNPFSEVFFSDDWVYWVMAGSKAAGNWLEQTPFLSAPLFPFLLGIVRWFGGTLHTVYLLHLGLGILCIFLIAIGTRNRFGATTALIASSLFAFAEEPALSFTKVMADSTQLFLVILVWFFWSRFSENKTAPLVLVFLTGMIIGLLILAWPPAQLLLFLYGIWLFFYDKNSLTRRLTRSVIGLAAGLIMISPATLHNYHADHEFVLVSANAGINLLQGNNQDAKGIITPIQGIRTDRQHMYEDAARVYAQATGHVENWKIMDAFFRDQAVSFMLENPVKSVQLFIKKFYWFLSSRHYDNISVRSLEREHGLYQRAILTPVELPWLMGLTILGLYFLAKNGLRYTPEITILLLTVIVCVVFHYSARYRLPAAPVLCIFSAVAITHWKALKLTRSIKLGITFLPVLFLIINQFSGFGSVDFMRADTATKIAHAYVEVGDRRVRAQNLASAILQYEKAVDAEPGYLTPYQRLAHLGLKSGQVDLTIRWASTAVTLPGSGTDFHRLLFNAYLIKQDYFSAAKILQKLVKSVPDDLPLQQKLVWFMATSPDDKTRNPALALDLARQLLGRTDGTGRIGGLVALAVAQLANNDREASRQSLTKAIKLAHRSGLTDNLETLEKMRREVDTLERFEYQATPFITLSPWDLSKPHPMDLIEF